MNKLRQRLEGLMGKMVIALIVISCLDLVFVRIGAQQSRANLNKNLESFEKSGVLPEAALARLDGKDSQQTEAVRPYSELLNQLEAKCLEPRAELMVMASGVTKHERKQQQQEVSYLEGLQTLLYDVGGFQKFPATCERAYSYRVRGNRQ